MNRQFGNKSVHQLRQTHSTVTTTSFLIARNASAIELVSSVNVSSRSGFIDATCRQFASSSVSMDKFVRFSIAIAGHAVDSTSDNERKSSVRSSVSFVNPFATNSFSVLSRNFNVRSLVREVTNLFEG